MDSFRCILVVKEFGTSLPNLRVVEIVGMTLRHASMTLRRVSLDVDERISRSCCLNSSRDLIPCSISE